MHFMHHATMLSSDLGIVRLLFHQHRLVPQLHPCLRHLPCLRHPLKLQLRQDLDLEDEKKNHYINNNYIINLKFDVLKGWHWRGCFFI